MLARLSGLQARTVANTSEAASGTQQQAVTAVDVLA